MTHGENISIIIPTLNRSDHIIKMMRYFQYAGFKGYVFIGDSSNTEHLGRTRRGLNEIGAHFTIVHREYPNRKNYECVRDLLVEVPTIYAVWMCDDDLLVPASLAKAAEFLESHPDYSGVGGVALQYQLTSPGAYGSIAWVKQYSVRAAEEETGGERLLNLFRNYSVVSYSLYRTDQLKMRFPSEKNLTDIAFATELIPTCMLAVQGKVKMLDVLFVVRQMHQGRYLLPDIFDWITKPDWQSSQRVFLDVVTEAVAVQDDIKKEEAHDIVKQALWDYLQQGMTKKFEATYSPTRSRLQHMSRTIARGFRRVSRIIQSMNERGISLQRLLDRRSPYHHDFMPVYRAIMSPPDEKR